MQYMLRKTLGIGALALFVIVGAMGYSFFKPPEEASAPIEAVPIAPDEVAPATPQLSDNPSTTSGGTDAAQEPAPNAAVDNAATANTEQTTFKMVPAESEVRFVIDEVLRGEPKTVVGVTDQVAGEIAVDFNSPSNSQIGTILVNARSLTTDSSFRNRALKNRILDTNSYEFVQFTPTGIAGLPEQVTLGESYTVQIVGELTVRDVTNQVTFDATITPVSETELQGTASTTILYADYGLTIPDARAVSSVEDEVRLEIDFVAVAG